jgi:hypothetical protein
MLLGNCPFCDDGMVTMVIKPIQGKNTKYYACSNYKVYSEDGEFFERTSDSKCGFRIFGNALLKYGKRGIGVGEVKRLLRGESVSVRLYSYNVKKEYYKYIYLDEQYGISVDWDTEVEDERDN